MSAESPEADLHRVSNTNTARSTNMTIDFCEIRGWKNDLPAHAGHRFPDVCSGSPAFHLEAMENLCDVASMLGAEARFHPMVNAAVIVGNRRHVMNARPKSRVNGEIRLRPAASLTQGANATR